ncbi:non-ribosomal peptide synthetase [Okeania sp. SIO1I7]|uniref:non-ribosomal peptide synthetase n=1 Tax=Okeania sp. SIO1I7 TaxID=2607772 RepID=UPI0025F52B48|nr:non-ribosomal peptide synthetase [Okeania sp. SIO1I7]
MKLTETVEFLSYLRSLGVKFAIDGGKLRCNAAPGVLTSVLRQEIAERKAEILELLGEAQTTQQSIASSIKPIPRDTQLPLSFSQQRLWFIEKTGLSGNAYNMPLTLHLVGQLDLMALQKSLNEIVARHETLRTNFAEINGTPVQVIRPPFELELPQQDLSGLAKPEQTTQLQQCLQAENEKQFNLEVDPPIRVLLLQMGATEHILQVTLHHIASDGWSLTVFAQELSAHYTAAVEDQPSSAPELPIQYADFAVWQRHYLQGQTLQTQLDYWKQKLKELPQLQLPTDYPRPPVETFNGTSIPIKISAALTSKLKQLSQQQGVTLFMTLLAGFKVLLHRYSGQEDIAIGVPVANRKRSEIEGLIGFFVNALVMYTDLGGELSFTEVLKRVRQTSLEAYAHQDVPFEKLVEELQPERSLSHNPLFRVSFDLQQSEVANPSFSLPNLEVSWYQEVGAEMTVRMDLELYLWQEGEEIKGLCAYNRDLFASETISRMLSHYQNLLYAAIETPEQPISLLPMMSASEQQQLLVAWNDTKTDYPTDKCIHELFETQVEQNPDAIAVVFAEQSLTYSELNNKANQLAHYLQKLGVKAEVLVGICVERSVEMVVGLLAILKAGGVYVPLDPSYPRSRLNYIISDSQISILLTQEKWLNNLTKTATQIICLETDEEIINQHSRQNLVNQVTATQLAYVIYTSGSTGKPKGVSIPHQGLLNLVFWHQRTFEVKFSDRASQIAEVAFDASVWEIWPYLSAGACLHLVNSETRLSPEALRDWLVSEKITISFVPTPLLENLCSLEWPPETELRTVLTGGDKLHSYPSAALPFRVFNNYGPTENTVVTTSGLVVSGQGGSISPPIGRPISNIKVYILDSHLQPVPIGVPGELHIGGDGLAIGYHNRPQLTAEKFIPNPFDSSKATKLYKTGDLVRYLTDGNIEFLGRIDHQVKIRGFRIETGEIEAVIHQNSEVKETVVIVREDKPGDKRLVAYIVPETETSNDNNPELSDTQVDSWQEIFNEQVYTQLSEITDPLFNNRGWLSNYDGQLIPVQQMRVWAGDIVSQVLASKPEKVWEVGCGTGMLLFQIAPHTQGYYGTDISQASLDYIQKQIEQQPEKYGHVTLAQRRAEDMADVAENSFDVVLLSSIVQYFPSVEYLLQVIENSIRVVKPGGMIFLGDIRNQKLREAFHTSVQMYKATPSLSIEKLKQQIDRVMQQETELLVSPELFVALKEKYQEISHVQIRLQRGSEYNELNKYRYSVLLHIEAKPATAIAPPVESGLGMSYEDMEIYLQQKQPELICFSSLTNSRVVNDVHEIELLSTMEEIKNVQQLQQKSQERVVNGINPERLYELSASLGYSLELCWAAEGGAELMDAVFVRSELAAEEMVLTPLTQKSVVGGNWHSYGNNPLASQIGKQVIPDLRKYLESRLPEYMIPSGYVVLSQLPLTPNGKVDRKALPAPDLTSSLLREFVAPQTKTEKALAEILVEVLGIEKVGIHDNFFDLGGHSLLATQVVSRVRNILNVELSLQSLFESSDVASLAKELDIYLAQTEGIEAVAITPRKQNGNLPPLSFAQQRLWFIEKTGLSENAYNQPLTIHLVGQLDLVALQQSLNQIINRHETLRTNFAEINGTPVQVIRPPFELELPQQDLSQLTLSQQATQLQHLLKTENEKQFDLEQDLPIRALLLQLGAKEHILQVTLHHIASDGWSLTVFTKELSVHYTAAVENQPSSLPELPIQYADFAVWQRDYLQGETLQTQLGYWKQKLKGLPQLQLPTDYPRPARETFQGAGQEFNLSATLTSKLKQLSKQQGVTLFMTLLAGFKVLLYRYSGQDSIAVGVPIANRNRREIEGLIGFFVNSLVMYTDLGGEPSFTEVLKRVRQTSLEAYAHQDLPFEKLVAELQPERSLSQHPLFQVSFALQQSEVLKPSFSLPNLEVGWYEGEAAEMTVRMDLELHLWPEGENIKAFCAYNRDLFEAETINRMLSHYENILSAAVETPEQAIYQLPIMNPKETQQLLVTWNQTQSATPDKCIHELFEQVVQQQPQSTAIIFEEQKLTYSGLNQKANQLAQKLRSLGVKAEVLVGICIERSIEMVIGLLGILKAGGAYVPIDPNYPAQRINYMLADSQVELLVTTSQIREKQGKELFKQQKIITIDQEIEKEGKNQTNNIKSQVQPNHLAYVIYTSGSTGKPKGVEIEHRCVTNFLKSMEDSPGIEPSEKLLAVTTISFDIAGLELYLPLIAGATVEIVTKETAKDGRKLLKAIEKSEATIMQGTPATWQMLINAGWSGKSQKMKILCGGEAISEKLGKSLQQTGGEIWNMYGPTETTIWSSIKKINNNSSIKSIGQPINNTQMYILDKNQQPVPIGVAGELHIGGAGLARGYRNQQKLTAEKFIPHPCSEEKNARIYKTGDQARYLPTGEIEYLGRIDNQVKIRGFRIETGEIETLLNENSTITEAVVVAKEEKPGEKRLLAYVVPKTETSVAEKQKLIETQLKSWSEIFNQPQEIKASEIKDPKFNISGWQSSYNNQAIPVEQMEEWAADIVTQVLKSKPETVCEIGCKTGMLLLGIAPKTKSYYGTDISKVSLEYIQKQIELEPEKYNHVTLAQKQAEALEGVAENSVDVVLLNSIVQYFPSVEYLLQVIEESLKRVKPGGVIILWDVRNLELRKEFHTSVQMYQATPSVSAEKIKQQLERVMQQEMELLVSPELFVALKEEKEEISHVQIRLQRGSEHNELSKYRYSVVLHKKAEGKDKEVIEVGIENGEGMSVAEIEQKLTEEKPEAIGWSQLVNKRIEKDVVAVELLSKAEKKENVQQLRQKLESQPVKGIDPEELYKLSEEMGYALELCWSGSGVKGKMDAVFVRRALAAEGIVLTPLTQKSVSEVNWQNYVNNPLGYEISKGLIPKWKEYLSERLPEYMLPSGYVVLSEMALTANGKVDRKALAAVDVSSSSVSTEFVAPETKTQKGLAQIWGQVLGIEKVGIHDNFFDLGGHSLMATQVLARIDDNFEIELPLINLFEAANIKELSVLVDNMIWANSASSSLNNNDNSESGEI